MQIKQLIAITAAILPLAAAVAAPNLDCNDPQHPCNISETFVDCSPQWVKNMQKYVHIVSCRSLERTADTTT